MIKLATAIVTSQLRDTEISKLCKPSWYFTTQFSKSAELAYCQAKPRTWQCHKCLVQSVSNSGARLTKPTHYNDVIMSMIVSQITSLTIVYSTDYSGADQRKHQSSASLAFVRRIHRGPVNSPHKGPVTRKMFPFDDVIMDQERNS